MSTPRPRPTRVTRRRDRRARRRRRARNTLAGAFVAIAAAGIAIGTAASGSTSGALESKISSAQAREGEVRSGIHADSHQIAGFEGNIEDLQTRLSALESSLTIERNLL